MPEEAPPIEQQQQQQAPESYVKPDGSFAENWHTRPEFTEFKGIERFKTVPELAKSYKELEGRLGRQAPVGVVVPGTNAKPEEIAEYRKAIGIPDAPSAYQLKPEKIPDGLSWNDALGLKMAERFHTEGVPPGAAKKIVEDWMNMEAESHLAAKTAYDNLVAKQQADLQKEWGAEYPHKLATVRGVVGALGLDPKDPELFNNPKVLSFLGKVTNLLSEDAIASMKGTTAGGGEFVSGADEARAIMRNADHPEHKKYMEGDPDVTQKVIRLLNAA